MRALVVDDSPAFRAVAEVLLTAAGHDVVGLAVDGTSALTETTRLHPDFVLLDVQLPDLDGFEVARRIADLAAPAAVVLVTARHLLADDQRAAGAPVLGLLRKEDLTVSTINAMFGQAPQ